ncbi:MAG: major facilitator superfamily transporter [Holophagaceae bacterium]|nr:major facilitator superfamily transporter [Holophagaceae bacterium]
MLKLPDALRALRHREFGLFASGQVISLIGTWMQMVAQSWLIYRLTGSSTALGLATFFGQLPILIFAPLGGLITDRITTRRLLLYTQVSAMLLALVLSILTLGHWVRLWHVVTAAFLLGLVNAFDNPGRQVFVAEAVPKEDLMNAIALNSSMVTGARFLGPAVAGLFVALWGEGWCFLLNALSYLAVIAALLKMKSQRKAKHLEHRGSPLDQLKGGFAFAGSSLPIRRLLILLGLLSLLGTSYSVLMPIFADHILHGGARALGILGSASGFGALAGALTMALRKRARGLASWIAGASLLFGISLLAFSMSRDLLLSALLLIPVGYTFMIEMAATNTLLQMMLPDAFRGRVMSIYTVMFLGMVPIGGLLVGGLGRFMSAPATVAVTGCGCIVAGAIFALGLPEWRRVAHQLMATKDDPVSKQR